MLYVVEVSPSNGNGNGIGIGNGQAREGAAATTTTQRRRRRARTSSPRQLDVVQHCSSLFAASPGSWSWFVCRRERQRQREWARGWPRDGLPLPRRNASTGRIHRNLNLSATEEDLTNMSEIARGPTKILLHRFALLLLLLLRLLLQLLRGTCERYTGYNFSERM